MMAFQSLPKAKNMILVDAAQNQCKFDSASKTTI